MQQNIFLTFKLYTSVLQWCRWMPLTPAEGSCHKNITQGPCLSAHMVYYHHTQFHTRQHHRDYFILLQAILNTYKYSFYPKTIKGYNYLPINVIEARDINEFTYLLNLNYCNYYFMYVCMWLYHLGFLPHGCASFCWLPNTKS